MVMTLPRKNSSILLMITVYSPKRPAFLVSNGFNLISLNSRVSAFECIRCMAFSSRILISSHQHPLALDLRTRKCSAQQRPHSKACRRILGVREKVHFREDDGWFRHLIEGKRGICCDRQGRTWQWPGRGPVGEGLPRGQEEGREHDKEAKSVVVAKVGCRVQVREGAGLARWRRPRCAHGRDPFLLLPALSNSVAAIS